jgi:hypothetical protein
MPIRYHAGFALVVALITAAPAAAQSSSRPPAALDFLAGYAGFADDATIDHGVAGASARFYVSPRLALGPELAYMWGPGFDRDLFLTGNLTFDLLRPQRGRPPRVSPFLVAGAGFSVYRNRFGPNSFTSYEGAVTGGGGVRVWFSDRVYATADFRLGWELHCRATGGVGISLGR